MASAKILVKIPVNSLTRKVLYERIPIGTKIIGIYR